MITRFVSAGLLLNARRPSYPGLCFGLLNSAKSTICQCHSIAPGAMLSPRSDQDHSETPMSETVADRSLAGVSLFRRMDFGGDCIVRPQRSSECPEGGSSIRIPCCRIETLGFFANHEDTLCQLTRVARCCTCRVTAYRKTRFRPPRIECCASFILTSNCAGQSDLLHTVGPHFHHDRGLSAFTINSKFTDNNETQHDDAS